MDTDRLSLEIFFSPPSKVSTRACRCRSVPYTAVSVAHLFHTCLIHPYTNTVTDHGDYTPPSRHWAVLMGGYCYRYPVRLQLYIVTIVKGRPFDHHDTSTVASSQSTIHNPQPSNP